MHVFEQIRFLKDSAYRGNTLGMEILITNDDGITNEGIIELAKWASTLGNVTVVAPEAEQSGKSTSINLKTSFRVRKADFPVPGVRAWAAELSPADCVAFAVHQLGIRPDYVFSGINRGYNIGRDISYSGTCGAIFEAGSLGYKAVAFSTRLRSLPSAVNNLQKSWDFVITNKLFDKHLIWNINYPEIPAEKMEMRFVRQGGIFLSDHFDKLDEDTYKRNRFHGLEFTDATTDIKTVLDGHIAITPMTIDQTDYSVLSSLTTE